MNNNILKERACRGERERENQHINDVINDHDNKINDLNDKLNTVSALYTQVTNDSKNFQVKNSKLKEHIMLLTQQNQKLLGELENVKEQDLRLKTLLSRKDQSAMLLNGVRNCIEQATIRLEKVESDPLGCNNLRNSGERVRVNSSEHYRSSSPLY